MPYNFVADSFHTKKLCSRRFFFKRSAISDGNRPFCVFEPPLGDLEAMYDDHLRLVGKRMGNFLFRAVFVRFSLGGSEFRLATSDYSGHGGCQIGTVE